MKLIPLSRPSTPKVKRLVLVAGSIPTVPIINPIVPAIRPFTNDLLPRLVIMARPRTIKAKYSGGPNARATEASSGPRDIRTIRLNVPAIQDPMAVIPRASPARP